VVVELDEGVRFVTNLRGVASTDEGGVHNGLEVAVSIEEVDGVVLPQFRPVDQVPEDQGGA
jgi:hypothetical protein